jgi:hypothetical protein
MSLDLLSLPPATGPGWDDPAAFWAARSAAVSAVSGPVAAIDLDALRFNAMDLVVRSAGVPIRVASKSIRVREVLDATLAIGGYRGILAFTLPEALWLAREHDDIVLGYPSVDRAALERLVRDDDLARRVTLMIDDLRSWTWWMPSPPRLLARASAWRSTRMHRGGHPCWATSACVARPCTNRRKSCGLRAPSSPVPVSSWSA